ncbi:MAG: hypothetical protein PVF04_03575, partial [Anaerolineae bacterium]
RLFDDLRFVVNDQNQPVHRLLLPVLFITDGGNAQIVPRASIGTADVARSESPDPGRKGALALVLSAVEGIPLE